MSQLRPEDEFGSEHATTDQLLIEDELTTVEEDVTRKDMERAAEVTDILSLSEPQDEKWTSARNLSTRIKARIAKKCSLQTELALAQLKSEFLVNLVTLSRAWVADWHLELPLATSKGRSKWAAKRALLGKGRKRNESCKNSVFWAGNVKETGDGTEAWWTGDAAWYAQQEEQGDDDSFEQYEVVVTWEETMLRESGKLKHFCPQPSPLRKSWTVKY